MQWETATPVGFPVCKRHSDCAFPPHVHPPPRDDGSPPGGGGGGPYTTPGQPILV